MSKPRRKNTARLKLRQTGYDSVKDPKTKKGMKRPGSMNSHKSLSMNSGKIRKK